MVQEKYVNVNRISGGSPPKAGGCMTRSLAESRQQSPGSLREFRNGGMLTVSLKLTVRFFKNKEHCRANDFNNVMLLSLVDTIHADFVSCNSIDMAHTALNQPAGLPRGPSPAKVPANVNGSFMLGRHTGYICRYTTQDADVSSFPLLF